MRNPYLRINGLAVVVLTYCGTLSAAPLTFKQIATAWAQFENGKYMSARTIVETGTKTGDHADLALLLLSKTFTLEAQKHLRVAAAEKALDVLFEMERRFPTMLDHQEFAEQVAENEFLLASALSKKSPNPKALPIFFNGFKRVPNPKIPALMGPQGIKGFSKSCAKVKTDECLYWARILFDLLPKSAVESTILKSSLGSYFTAPLPGLGIDRVSKSYKAPDLDQAALDELLPLIHKRQWAESLPLFQKFFDLYPKSTHRQRVLFWYGRALTALAVTDEQKTKAKEPFQTIAKEGPLSFYGLQSAVQLNLDIDSFLSDSAISQTALDAALSPVDLIHWNRGKNALTLKSHALARRELADIAFQKFGNNEFLLNLASQASQAGAYLLSFRIVGELGQRGYPALNSRNLIPIFFPIVHLNTIKIYGNAHQVDPLLILSQMKQESAFDPIAISSAGAAGLMQLMPTTAVDVESDVDQMGLRQPDNSIRIGTKYLSEMIKRFNGNWVLALCAYNAGPHRAEKWLKESQPNLSPLEFIETIPFKETREYVMQIFRNYYWYQFIVNGKRGTALQEFWKNGLAPETKRTDNSI